MPKPEILVCDDNGVRARAWKSEIEQVPEVCDAFEVVCPSVEEFAEIFRALRERQAQARPGAPRPEPSEAIARLDAAAAVIVDFDLTPSHYDAVQAGEKWVHELAGSFGNVFAYLARTFSQVPCTVVVNQDFPSSTFDLTMNRFQFSAADLNVAAPDLQNRGLWTGNPTVWAETAPFRPWHWPNLIEYIGRIQRLRADIELDADVFDTLGLGAPSVMAAFAVSQLEPLRVKTLEKPTITFREFAELERYGKLASDYFTTEEQVKAVAVSAVCRWLDRTVLSGQNVIIDAPHLVSRRPGLTSRPVGDWSDFANLEDRDAVIEMFDAVDIAGAYAKASEWLGRPVWYWGQVPIVASALIDRVFCEDTSRFVSFDEATDFESSVPGPVRQRYVQDLDEEQAGTRISYDPELRLF